MFVTLLVLVNGAHANFWRSSHLEIFFDKFFGSSRLLKSSPIYLSIEVETEKGIIPRVLWDFSLSSSSEVHNFSSTKYDFHNITPNANITFKYRMPAMNESYDRYLNISAYATPDPTKEMNPFLVKFVTSILYIRGRLLVDHIPCDFREPLDPEIKVGRCHGEFDETFSCLAQPQKYWCKKTTCGAGCAASCPLFSNKTVYLNCSDIPECPYRTPIGGICKSALDQETCYLQSDGVSCSIWNAQASPVAQSNNGKGNGKGLVITTIVLAVVVALGAAAIVVLVVLFVRERKKSGDNASHINSTELYPASSEVWGRHERK